ncbi:hypothetical protein B0T21DRAFT_431893 [Apiosordaria backusii]|uniref:Uncharacterized protein n=1 Tax=Apiosordaria backusii TaxID=314023 RepID=A0AA40DIG3_9PEZI|nr:hypothetical protein B0T21DRAFT_431893 [Apiosordaria backusii]
MLVQVIGRAAKHLPISLLEINTCGHVACALVIYLLWWNKPLDILVPTLLPDNKEMKEALALMHLCSPETGGAYEHGIMDIRCFVHTPVIAADNDAQEMSELRTHLSIGSPGSRNPAAFLGFGQLWSGSNTPYTQYSVRHSHYCRRGFPDAQQSPTPRPLLPPLLLETASGAADRLRTLCTQRLEYQPFYFTLGFGPKLAYFFGETDYLVPHIVNFPSLHKLFLGQVNIHRDRLRAVLAATAAAYGALHCSAGFNNFETFSFVTEPERIMWVVSALTITASGVLLWGFFSARQYWPGFDVWVSGVNPAMPITLTGKEGKRQGKWMRWGRRLGAFVSLRRAPRGLYETPEWADFLPHL